MTKERMIELLEIEHECMRRGAHNECDRDCANCELVQDDRDLDEMYTGVIALLKEQEAKVMNAQFAEMTFKNGNSMFLNTEYITSYGYLKDRDETAVSVLSEAKEIYFPGDQTAEIRSAFNRINEDGR